VNNLIRKILRESLLLENRVDTVFEKYKEKYHETYITHNSFIDHKHSDALFKGVLTYEEDLVDTKYLDWFIKIYLQQWDVNGIPPSDVQLGRLIETINKFDKKIPKINTNGFKNHIESVNGKFGGVVVTEKVLNNITDINVYPDEATLKFITDETDNYVTPTQKKKIVKQETKKIYEDDDVLIIEPLSEASSCMYGANTKWCTASREGQNMFTNYKNKTSTLIYIIGKTDEMVEGKWALHLGYEMALSDDFEYCRYTLYNEKDVDVDGGPYYGKGDLDEPLRAFVGLHDAPYRAIENFYNTRLKTIRGL
jgi:hypothetical protein